MVTNINFLLTISIDCPKIRLWELIDHLRENALIFYQILSTYSLWQCIEISLENLYVDIGAWRVNPIFFYQHLLVHHPHQTKTSLHHLHDDNMPPSVKYFSKAVELKPQE